MTIYLIIGALALLVAIADVLIPRRVWRKPRPQTTALARRVVVLR